METLMMISIANSANEFLPINVFGMINKRGEDHYQKTITLLTDSKFRNDMAFQQRGFAMSHLSWINIGQQILSAVA